MRARYRLLELACAIAMGLTAVAGHCQPPPGLAAPFAPGMPMTPFGPQQGLIGHPGIVIQVPPNPEAMHMMVGGQSQPAIAVAEGFVFVVYGGTLFQFTMDGLMEVAKTRLVPAEVERAGVNFKLQRE